MKWVCIDGELVSGADAKISVWDHGYLYGDGLFETMRAYGGKVFALQEHLARLRTGAGILSLDIPYPDQVLEQFILVTLRKNELTDAYIRLTYSRGPGPIGLDPALCPKGTLVIMAKPIEVPEQLYTKGMSLGICPIRQNPIACLSPEIKSLNFLNNILAKIWAKNSGYMEAVLLSTEGWVAESTVSNIFFVKQGKVFTPALEVGLLSGITRNNILQSVRSVGLECAEGYYTADDLCSADEVFLTNSGSEVIPVVNIDGKVIGSGEPGIWTSKIHTLFRAMVKERLGFGFSL